MDVEASTDIETASQFSEAPSTAAPSVSQANQPPLPTKDGSAALFTCLACHVAFYSAENQREHYRSDWHRYNLKRKVTELPPVTQDNFIQRLKAQQAKTTADTARSTFQATCEACQKSYSSENAFANHMTSKKHREVQEAWDRRQASSASVSSSAKPSPAAVASSSSSTTDASAQPEPEHESYLPWRVRLAQATTPDELNKLMDEKIANAPRLGPGDCLFCTHTSPSLDENIEHMAIKHSFFIPDLEFLVDLEGLIKYLGEKISVGNICLYCNGRGRAMHSVEAVRAHMLDKGHCKMAYEDGAEMEVSDYYDFSSTWEGLQQKEDGSVLDDADAVEDDGAEEWEDESDIDGLAMANAAVISNDETTLTLTSGRTVLNRQVHKTHPSRTSAVRNRQAMMQTAPGEKAALALVARVAGKYASLDAVAVRTERGRRAAEVDARRQNRDVERGYRDFRTRVGIRQNKGDLNKHFRSQIGFD